MAKRVGLSYSKLRERVGIVGISTKDRNIHVRLALAWKVEHMRDLPIDVARLYRQYRWETTWIDQTTGEYLIQELRKKYYVPVSVFTSQKQVKDICRAPADRKSVV